jgi:predicted phosphate transport protein (TIGR00153 family)
MFGESPVSPLQRHMRKVQDCVQCLPAFFRAVQNGDWDEAARHQAEISRLEDEADSLKKSLRLHLPKGMMLAMSRRDVLDALAVQDNIANTAKDIAGLMLGRRMAFPPSVSALMIDFVIRSLDAVAQADRAINELDELVETGFRGHEVDVVTSMLTELDRIEADTDAIQVRVRAELFAREREMPAVDVIFMYRIIDEVGDLADLAQRVGSRLQLMLAR